jgi:hypothetical protein
MQQDFRVSVRVIAAGQWADYETTVSARNAAAAGRVALAQLALPRHFRVQTVVAEPMAPLEDWEGLPAPEYAESDFEAYDEMVRDDMAGRL